jgi:hypothetical protein
MSTVYEARAFSMHDVNYPTMDDHSVTTPDAERYADPSDAVVGELAAVAFVDTGEPRLDLSTPSLPKEDSPTPTTPQRIKPIPKPDREVTKNVDGKYVCTWPDCAEDVRSFSRKCEWK